MRQFPNNSSDQDRNDNFDPDFVRFLQQYQPLPPNPSQGLEERIMSLIQTEPPGLRLDQRFWMIPTAIATGLCLLWGGSRWMQSNTPLAGTMQTQEIEAFLVDNWQTVVTPEPHSPALTTSVNDWQLLTQPEMTGYLSTAYQP
ncbi:MAG: hypothetical protein VKJ02_16775 [Snowella sp.]|nr:hypothetical protein [Snowella sp.]